LSKASQITVQQAPCVVFGYHELGYVCIQALLGLDAPIAALFTHRDDPGEEIWWHSCAQLAAEHRVPVFYEEQFGLPWIDKIRAWAPALIYSFNYRRLLPRAVLECPSIGALNMHPSKLPAYRGRAPINWVLVNGERETGVTLHYMVARADAGDIVAQETIAIDDDDTALTLSRKLTPLAARLITRFHPQIVAGTAPRRPQDLSAGSYFGRRTPADGRIDWNWPARRIFNLVRAVTHPYPGAFCFVAEHKLLIWQATIGSEEGCFGQPGNVIKRNSSGLEVAAGQGSVVLRRVQFENEPEIAASELPARLKILHRSLKQVQTLFN
jgi:UDP-4-amino-4-deoxy-L-arabinose formyltransferase/UDP-glucuronic acid dehydrogenase (UDP-4-keto-hexauronic acid decarboxylating)